MGGLLEQLLADHGWTAPVTGGSLADVWPRACPEYADKVTAGHYDPDTGRLDLHPISPTYATQLRLLESALIKRINTAVGAETVRSLRVVPPGNAPGTPPARAKPRPHPGATAATPQHRIPEAPPRESVRDVDRHGTHGPGPAGRNAWARAIARARRERHQAPTARRDGELDPSGSITNDTDIETNGAVRGQDR
nr:DUF721 domain-containing protein [Streptomyces sp. SID3343]